MGYLKESDIDVFLVFSLGASGFFCTEDDGAPSSEAGDAKNAPRFVTPLDSEEEVVAEASPAACSSCSADHRSQGI